MKVLFSAWRYHPNHDGLVLGLVEAGHEVAFLVNGAHPTERYVEGVTVTEVRPSRVLGLLARGRDRRWHQKIVPSPGFLARALRAERPDVVVARDLTPTNGMLFLMCRLRGIPYLLYTQNRDGYEAQRRLSPLMLALGLWPRHTISTTIRAPARAIPGKTFDFIPFSVAAYDHEKRDYPAAPPIRVFAVGKFDSPSKNNAELVRSLAPMLRAGTVRLTILGLRDEEVTPAYRRLLDAIAEEGVDGAVTLVEELPYDESRRLYARHDLFVMVSSRESAGIAPVEAMTTGLPVIVGSDVGTKYFVREGETGFVFPDRDFAAFAARVAHFVERPAELERMGRNARALMLDHHAPRDFERRFVEIVARRFPRAAEVRWQDAAGGAGPGPSGAAPA